MNSDSLFEKSLKYVKAKINSNKRVFRKEYVKTI